MMGMSKQGAFMIYCAEQYKLAKHLPGKNSLQNCSANIRYGNMFIPVIGR
jgi:hypothetical protein